MVDSTWEEDVDETWDDTWDPEYDLDDPEDPSRQIKLPRRPTRARRLLVLGGVALGVLLLLGLVVAFWVRRQVDPPGDPGPEVLIEVPDGATTTDVASLLEEERIITNGLVFRVYVRYKGAGPFQAGQYDGLRVDSSMGDVVARLDQGPLPPAFSNVTIPEGLVLTQIVPKLTTELPFDQAELEAALLAARSSFMPEEGTSLEGFVFPDTYRIEEGDEEDEAKLVEQMMTRFDEVATELGYGSDDPAVNPTGRSPYELLIIASMIEREARVPEDQAKISRVIHNRLEQGMPLEIDATLLYSIGHREDLTQSDLETDTPYNTRLHEGLPPTPIASPGRGALEAAIRPAEGDWLFYVLADADGRHFFTSDYDAFVNQKNESQEEGLF